MKFIEIWQRDIDTPEAIPISHFTMSIQRSVKKVKEVYSC